VNCILAKAWPVKNVSLWCIYCNCEGIQCLSCKRMVITAVKFVKHYCYGVLFVIWLLYIVSFYAAFSDIIVPFLD